MVEIDPWGSSSVVDYAHVFKEFGLKPFPAEWKTRFPSHLFSRDIVIGHRDFDKVLARIDAKKPFIQLTGIASSGPFHLGHKVDIDLFLAFKKAGARCFFCVADLDAFLSRPDEKIPSLDAARAIAVENVKDLLALGFDEKDIYVQSKYSPAYYALAFALSKRITMNTFEGIYGHLDMGKIGANFLQYADILHPQLKEFAGKMPSVTGIGLDQDPHARASRDIAKRLGLDLELPSFIYFRHQSGLREGAKMSSSEPDTAIFLSDAPEVAAKKIGRAFTGGRNTVEEHRKLGGDISVDKVYELLLFHHPDDALLVRIAADFSSGKMLSSEMKKIAQDYFSQFLKDHQKKAKSFESKAKKIVFG